MNRRGLATIGAGLAGGVAWVVALMVFFLPAQAILTNPEHQSAKFLSVMGTEPLPRVATDPWILPLGLLVLGVVYGFVYSAIRGGLGQGSLSRGFKFGLVAWALMVPWFEFFLPWSAMHEPALLVLLEMVLWLLVLLVVGVTIASVYERIARPAA